jgi:hypothetical protein
MKLRYDWQHFEAFWASFADTVPGWAKKNCERVMDQIRLGWTPEDKAYELFKIISQDVRGSIPKTIAQRSVSGGTLRVPALLAGRPDHFHRNVPLADVAENKKGKTFIKICTNVDAVAGVGPELFKLRGATTVALAEALEAAGKRVELSVAIATTPFTYNYSAWINGNLNPEKNQRYFVGVKPFSSPVSPLLHSYPLMSPNILRTLFFTFWAHGLPEDEKQHFYNGTHGAVGAIEDHGADLYIAEFGAHNAGNYTNTEGAKKWIIEQMKAFGVDINAGK